jgi:hypothetical protein
MWSPAALFAAGAMGGFVGTAVANRIIMIRMLPGQRAAPPPPPALNLTKEKLQGVVATRSDAAGVTYAIDFRNSQLKRFPTLKGYDLPDWFIEELRWLPDTKMKSPNEYRHLSILIDGMQTADEVAAVNALVAHFREHSSDSV